MKKKILKLKKKISLYEISLDMGISESSLYNYLNDYKTVSSKIKDKITRYFKERENASTTNKVDEC